MNRPGKLTQKQAGRRLLWRMRLGTLALLLTLLLGCQDSGPPSRATAAATDRPLVATATKSLLSTLSASTEQSRSSSSSLANADVTFVRAILEASGSWTFHVTVTHPDIGWEDYSDGWDVVLPDGEVIKPNEDSPFTRTLLHPHLDEQPFTRSQGRILIPAGVTKVLVRAHDLKDGFGGDTVTVDLSAPSGPDFSVER